MLHPFDVIMIEFSYSHPNSTIFLESTWRRWRHSPVKLVEMTPHEGRFKRNKKYHAVKLIFFDEE
jgi:hypothetical protein